jgi:glycosyltransferase involved in cell wall biosynthesis
MHSTAALLPVPRRPILEEDVPEADVTIATWWETAEWIWPWSAKRGKKAYFIRHYELHGGEPERVMATYRLPMQKFVIANWLKRIMAEEYGDSGAVLVPNGVDRDQFDSVPRERNEVPRVGFLFGFVPYKGTETALEALRLVQRELPDLRVVSFGMKPLDPGAYALPEHFEYHHRPSQREIPEIYRSADCWILPSVSEGFGMPGIEAAACRCPLVVTRCGGPEDYTEDGVNGHIVEVGNAAEMAARVLDILRASPEQWRAMSESSYEISKRFDWDRSALVLEEALIRLVTSE